MDLTTSSQVRERFARLCMQINLKTHHISKVHIIGYNQRIEYEGLHHICFEYGQYGQRIETCPSKIFPANQEVRMHVPP